jgi:ribosomal protein S18 acetylase RimI-like enzyme
MLASSEFGICGREIRMNGILIRPVEEKDLPAIVELLQQLREYAHGGSDIQADQVRRLYSKMMRMPEQYKNMVACKDEAIVGFISVVNYLSFYHKGGTALINELIVSKVHRNEGIGKALVQRAIAISRESGMDEIEVGTEKDNEHAIAFYHGAGFNEEYVLLGKEFGS